MGKITVKHYLNTNLKPYIINGEQYFSIYALVTANRQNTKVKSIAFNEYYTEADFKEIINPESKKDYELIKNEEQTIINIASLLINEFDNFDTTLFASIYNYYQSIYLLDLDLDVLPITEKEGKNKTSLYDEKINKLGVRLDALFYKPFALKENQGKGMSVFLYFSAEGQSELYGFLELNKCPIDINKAVEILNKIVFYRSSEKLSWILRGSKKFESLNEKYSLFFEFLEENIKPLANELSN